MRDVADLYLFTLKTQFNRFLFSIAFHREVQGSANLPFHQMGGLFARYLAKADIIDLQDLVTDFQSAFFSGKTFHDHRHDGPAANITGNSAYTTILAGIHCT